MLLLHVSQVLDLCAGCLSVLMKIYAISCELFFFAGIRTVDGKDRLPKKDHFKNREEFKQREFIS